MSESDELARCYSELEALREKLAAARKDAASEQGRADRYREELEAFIGETWHLGVALQGNSLTMWRNRFFHALRDAPSAVDWKARAALLDESLHIANRNWDAAEARAEKAEAELSRMTALHECACAENLRLRADRDQHIKFVDHRNKHWRGGSRKEFKAFALAYADSLEAAEREGA